MALARLTVICLSLAMAIVPRMTDAVPPTTNAIRARFDDPRSMHWRNQRGMIQNEAKYHPSTRLFERVTANLAVFSKATPPQYRPAKEQESRSESTRIPSPKEVTDQAGAHAFPGYCPAGPAVWAGLGRAADRVALTPRGDPGEQSTDSVIFMRLGGAKERHHSVTL